MSFSNWDFLSKLVCALSGAKNIGQTGVVCRISGGEIINLTLFATICVSKSSTFTPTGETYYLFLVVSVYLIIFHCISVYIIVTETLQSKKTVFTYKAADLIYDILLLIFNNFVHGLISSYYATVITVILSIDIFVNLVCLGNIIFNRKCTKKR